MFTLKSILICSQTWCSSCNHPHNANRFSKTTKALFRTERLKSVLFFVIAKKKEKENKKERKKEIQIMGGFQIGWFSWVVNIVCLTARKTIHAPLNRYWMSSRGKLRPKMKILMLFTHCDIVSNLYDLSTNAQINLIIRTVEHFQQMKRSVVMFRYWVGLKMQNMCFTNKQPIC